jgi:tRNA threonylcarbamoyl adenosine modification protein (Sua5/YciO/YrdC/YwlC family)
VSSELLDEAAIAVRRGAIVGVPTDTVYGLAVDPLQTAAVQSLFELKGRPRSNPVGLLGAAVDQFEPLIDMTASARSLADRQWPGPLTLVVKTRVPLPDWVGDHDRGTVAIRVPGHALARSLFSIAGPLAVTSANLSGLAPAVNDVEARAVFGEAVDVYLTGACPGGTASTVVDVTVDPPRVLREGPIELS